MKMVLLTCLLLIFAGCVAVKKGDTVIMNDNGINTVRFEGKEMDWFRFGNENGPKVVILPGVS